MKITPNWLTILLIILSNDVQLDTGHSPQNSIAKDNFERVGLIEAHNSIFNYDLISLLNNYTFVPVNNPANTRHGGVGFFFKNTLPIIIRNDLSFEESRVVELKFGRKFFFLLFYIEALHLIIIILNFISL